MALTTVIDLPIHTTPRWRAQKLRRQLIHDHQLKSNGFVSYIITKQGQAVWRIAHQKDGA